VNTVVLNSTQLSFLEELMLHGGKVVTYEEMAPFAAGDSDVLKRQFISQLAKAGWLVRIKKGVYEVANISSLGTLTLSRYVIAQILAPGSYVSFEAALQYHGMYDQLLKTTTSVGLSQRPAVTVQGYHYRFVKTGQKFFWGFEEYSLDNQKAVIALPEKALIDMVQLHRSAYSTDRVAESLTEYQECLNLERLLAYLLRCNLTTQRIFGLLLEALGLPYSQELLHSAQQGQATSKLTPESTEYNARWRLYHPLSFLERYSRHS
jgi:predicted transcriptional regulator of viral defense system